MVNLHFLLITVKFIFLEKKFGVLVLDDNQKVIHYAEKPETYVNNIINCGVKNIFLNKKKKKGLLF